MDNEEIRKFIRQHSSLFWYIPDDKKEGISEEVLVEFILNYGDMEAVKSLLSLYGIDKVAETFFKSINLSERRKGNYNELTLNFFTIFFSRHAQRDSDRKTE